MKILEIIKTANSNLFRSKVRTFLTIMAVFVGSLTLTLTTAVGAGVNDYVDKQTSAVALKDIIQVYPGGFDNPFSGGKNKEYDPGKTKNVTATVLTPNDFKIIEGIEGIETIYPISQFQIDYITRGENEKKFQFSQVNVTIDKLELPLAAGRQMKSDEKNGLLLAYSYLETLGYSKPEDAINQKVQISFQNQTGQRQIKEVVITGVLINSLAGQFSRISFELGKEISEFQFGGLNTSSIVIAGLKKDTPASEVLEIKKRIIDKGYLATTFEDDINTIKGGLAVIQAVLTFFAAIAILAASIGIINTLFMSVYERTREVGLMKALGMKDREVFSIFAFEAVSIGFWGGMAGILFGVGLGFIINYLMSKYVLTGFEGFNLLAFPILKMIPIVLATMLVGLLAGTLPAIKASKLNPIEALKYE
jgi:putative ABC transport system permease protein